MSREQIEEMMQEGSLKPINYDDFSERPGFIQRNAILFSVLFFLTIFFTSAFLIQYVFEVRSVAPLPLDKPPISQIDDQYITKDERLEMNSHWEAGNYLRLNNNISRVISLNQLPEELEAKLMLSRLKLLMYAGEYDKVDSYSKVVMTKFSNQREMYADLLWIKGHLYYEKERYIQSLDTFRDLTELNDARYQEKADKYVYELRELTDQATFADMFF